MNAAPIEELVAKVQALPQASARQVALELVQAVMDLHSAGLERMLEIASSPETGGSLVDAFASDNLVSSILLLHDLHPLDLETRIRRALGATRFTALSVHDGVVRVRIDGDSTPRAEVRALLVEAAPDAVSIEVESAADFVPLVQLTAG